ncbi:MAG: ACT domain-containing protein [Acidobacteriota bacterium]
MPVPERGVRVRLWAQRYAIARLAAVPPGWTPPDAGGAPVCLVIGNGEVSFLAPEDLVERYQGLIEQLAGGWRAITLDAVLPLSTVGLLAAVSRALAEVGIPVLCFASHDTDHFLVPEAQLGRALAVLHQVDLDSLLAV